MFPPSTKVISTNSISSQEKMKLKPTPLPGQRHHQQPRPCAPVLMLALPPPGRSQSLHTPCTPSNVRKHHHSHKRVSTLPLAPGAQPGCTLGHISPELCKPRPTCRVVGPRTHCQAPIGKG